MIVRRQRHVGARGRAVMRVNPGFVIRGVMAHVVAGRGSGIGGGRRRDRHRGHGHGRAGKGERQDEEREKPHSGKIGRIRAGASGGRPRSQLPRCLRPYAVSPPGL